MIVGRTFTLVEVPSQKKLWAGLHILTDTQDAIYNYWSLYFSNYKGAVYVYT